MTISKSILCLALILAAASLAQDEPNAAALAGDWSRQTLTLAECEAMVLARNAAAVNARRETVAADHRIEQARAATLPRIGLTASYLRQDETATMELGGMEWEVGVLNQYMIGAEIAQALYAGGRIEASVRAARLARAHADWQRRDVEAQLMRDVRLAFYRMLLTQETLRVREESMRHMTALVEQTRRQRQGRIVSEYDVLSAQTRLANERTRETDARHARDLARIELLSLLTMDEDAAVVFEGKPVREPTPQDANRLRALALASHPALKMAAARSRIGREDIEIARAESRPSVHLFAATSAGNTDGVLALEDRWQTSWHAGVRLAWNLWDGRLTQHRVAERHIAARQHDTEQQDLRRRVLLDVRRAWMAARGAEEAMAAAAAAVALAERTLTIAQARHESGQATLLEFTDANLALSTARLDRAHALFRHAEAMARLRYACGTENLEP